MNEPKNIRWGIIGAGKIARAFVNDFPYIKNASLVAIAARDKNKAENFAREYNIPLFMDYEEMYTSPQVDAVYIATTHNFHIEQALKCIQHGKAVLCEKPITVNIREFNLLAAAAREHKVFLMEALWTCFIPAIKIARQWLDAGRIGPLKVIQADFSFPFEKNYESRVYNPALAGGSLLDIGIYPISMASYFTNSKPTGIKATAVLAHTGVDESAFILMEYAGITAMLASSNVTRMNNTLYLFGEEGTIEVPEYWKATKANLYDRDKNLIDSYFDERTSRGFNFEMQEATDCILAGKLESDIVPLSLSREWQETMMEVRRQVNVHYPMDDIT
ncbi:Gfo/Idh/MocA family protein [Flavihumibacter profundi]|uniref:Gfo/Idh/MocA family protein n=1 Tax=Flavihumibacter profundi TaxID=2716883 RepID=UPI001CC47393|nr:Gfo/Idh/MocA family oxidoreductase [Flavihumibacter profundi]MBZ5855914.1 Gfo/Idh/MocA family oxidoreductase [Flavihumibacter profundi]